MDDEPICIGLCWVGSGCETKDLSEQFNLHGTIIDIRIPNI